LIDTDLVLAVERAYVAAATEPVPRGDVSDRGPALACAGAVASRFLAVGTPRSFAIVGAGPGAHDSLAAHRTWFQPRDLRCTDPALGLRVVPIAEALTADIVCIHEPMRLVAAQLRRGTHVNALADVELDDELHRIATIVDEPHGLPALAAGLADGRQLDELTVFVAGDATIARAAWHVRCNSSG
jgi:ornithine cyclodeaminase/alanine dehydrogenase-like protein (mu-crystallin family)